MVTIKLSVIKAFITLIYIFLQMKRQEQYIKCTLYNIGAV